jgi:hypothetical protein
VERGRRRPDPVTDGDGAHAVGRRLAAERAITGDEDDRHVDGRGGQAVQPVLRRRLAVEPDGEQLRARQRVRERVAAAASAAVVTDEDRGVEGFVEALHHGERVAVVAADEAHRHRQRARRQVAAVAVGVLHDHLVGTGGQRPLARGGHLGVHLRPERRVPPPGPCAPRRTT